MIEFRSQFSATDAWEMNQGLRMKNCVYGYNWKPPGFRHTPQTKIRKKLAKLPKLYLSFLTMRAECTIVTCIGNGCYSIVAQINSLIHYTRACVLAPKGNIAFPLSLNLINPCRDELFICRDTSDVLNPKRSEISSLVSGPSRKSNRI